MNYEQDRAQMEAERNAAEDEYFAAQPYKFYKDSDNARIFFSAGWNERNKKVIELQERNDKLAHLLIEADAKINAEWRLLQEHTRPYPAGEQKPGPIAIMD